MSDPAQSQFPPVSEAESGQKLLRFLERRLGLPENLLHRWLRTGQIRVNGKRCKPFDRVSAGDEARLPPFAFKLAASASPDLPLPPHDPSFPPLLGTHGGVWAFRKPAGLLCHADRSGAPSVASLLAGYYKGSAFIPAPAHRLDRDTSGVLLVGATFQALRDLQIAFSEGRIHKEYLAWVKGKWEKKGAALFRHYLADESGIRAWLEYAPGRAEAICAVRPLLAGAEASLLHVRPITGRKRQIRAQMAALGHPLIGDQRYGDKSGTSLKLHACRAVLPDEAEFSCLPAWSGDFAVETLPEPFIMDEHLTIPDKSRD